MYGGHHLSCLADVILSQALSYPCCPSLDDAYNIEGHMQHSVRMTGGDEMVHLCHQHGETAGKVFISCCGQAWEVTRVWQGTLLRRCTPVQTAVALLN